MLIAFLILISLDTRNAIKLIGLYIKRNLRMQIRRSDSGLVVKYIHDDGSETVIKSVNSCGNKVSEKGNSVDVTEIDRNKYSMFVSSSVGCPLKCKFCALTQKGYPYKKLTNNDIVSNVKDTLQNEFEFNRYIGGKFLKLSYMGMGDALLLEPRRLRCLTKEILRVACVDGPYAKGIDGVDISTVVPRKHKGWPFQLGLLNEDLYNRYRMNPDAVGRSPVRLFYSLHDRHGAVVSDKNYMSKDLIYDIKFLTELTYTFGIDVIIHHMFLDGVNDADDQVSRLLDFLWHFLPFVQLRILRYNDFKDSPYKNSTRFDELVLKCHKEFTNVKYQVSLGTDIGASCGTFEGPLDKLSNH